MRKFFTGLLLCLLPNVTLAQPLNQLYPSPTYFDLTVLGTLHYGAFDQVLGQVHIHDSLIDSSPIGSETPSTGVFTSVNATGGAITNLTVSGTLTTGSLNFTSINNTPIGNITPSTGAFTTLTSSGASTNTGGNATIGTNTFANPALNINGASSTARGLFFKTAGITRWRIAADNTAESGANAGSLLNIIPFSDAGGALGTLVQMSRVDGTIFLNPNNSAAFVLGGLTSNLATHNLPKGNITQNGTRVFVPGFNIGTPQNPGNYISAQTWTGSLSNSGAQEPWYWSITDMVNAPRADFGGGTLVPFNISHNYTAGAVPVAAGSGYHVNNILTDTGGNKWIVTAINGSGGVTTLFLDTGGQTLPVGASAVTGGDGTGATVAVTGAGGPRGVGILSFKKSSPSVLGDEVFGLFGALGTYTAGEGGQAPDVDGTIRYKGVYKAMNVDARASQNADWLRQLQLGEFDIALTAGLHSLSTVGVNINYANNHGAEADYENSAWVVDRSPTATAGTTYAFAVGTQSAQVPFIDTNLNTAIVGVQRNLDGNNGGKPLTVRMQRVIDARYVDALTNQWEGAGFKLTPGGALNVGPGVVSFDATNGLKVTSPGVVAVSAVVVNGGGFYTVGDTIWDTEGNAWTVATTTAGGVMATLTLLHAAASGTCPAPASVTKGGTGNVLPHPENTPATITVTCATPLGVLVADTGQKLGFYGTAPVAKQTGVAVSAAGIHAALVNLGLIAP